MLDALYVGAPNVAGMIRKWAGGYLPDTHKVQIASLKYLARMSSRPTPFGLFAGSSFGSVGTETALDLGPLADYRRHVSLNGNLLEALTRQAALAEELWPFVRYVTEASLWLDGPLARYYVTRFDHGIRRREPRSFLCTEAMCRLLEAAREPGRIDQLVTAACMTGFDDHELTIAAQRLVRLEALIPEVLAYGCDVDAVLPWMRDLGSQATNPVGVQLSDVGEHLRSISLQLRELCHEPLGTGGTSHQNIEASLAGMVENGPPEGECLVTSLHKPARRLEIGPEIIDEVRRGVRLLHLLSGTSVEQRYLDTFKERFWGRFRVSDVPLLEAVDPETGVVVDTSAAPSGIGQIAAERPAAIETWLGDLVGQALHANRQEIDVPESGFPTAAECQPQPLPRSLAANVSLGARSTARLRRGDFQLVLNAIAAPAGVSVNRYGAHDPRVRQWLSDQMIWEGQLRPETDIAVVDYLPERLPSNLATRPTGVGASIAVDGPPPTDCTETIRVDDLMVSVLGGRIALRSRRTGRVIEPRILSAHDYRRWGVPAYRLLGLLQWQGVAALRWSWGPLEALPFLPRVTSGRLVLTRARWRLTGELLTGLRRMSATDRVTWFQEWRTQTCLPRFVYLVEDFKGQQLIDCDHEMSLRTLVGRLAESRQARLVEMLPDQNNLVVKGPEGLFCSDLIIPFRIHSEEGDSVHDAPRLHPIEGATPHTAVHGIGSEWACANVYASPSLQDEVLVRLLMPLARSLQREGAIRRWFFVRYEDPSPHIRFRLHSTSPVSWGLLATVMSSLNQPLGKVLTRRSSIEPYAAEMERYGGPIAIDVVEDLFWHDSEAACSVLQGFAQQPSPSWRLEACMRSAHGIMIDLCIPRAEQLSLIRRMIKRRRGQLRESRWCAESASRLWRQQKIRIQMLTEDDPGRTDPLAIPYQIRTERHQSSIRQLLELDARAQVSTSTADIADSLIHMSCNRLLPRQLRRYELLAYELLDRSFLSRLNRDGGYVGKR